MPCSLSRVDFWTSIHPRLSLRGQNRPRMCGLKPATEGVGYADRFRHERVGRVRHVQSAFHGQHLIHRNTAPIGSFEPGNCSNTWTCHRLQSLHYGPANLLCRLVAYDPHGDQTQSPVGYGHEIAAIPSAFHGVALSMTTFRPMVCYIRKRPNGTSIPNSTTQIF
jgi:hypothetical protein